MFKGSIVFIIRNDKEEAIVIPKIAASTPLKKNVASTHFQHFKDNFINAAISSAATMRRLFKERRQELV